MGQYYSPIILSDDKKKVWGWLYSHDYDSGLKLMEHSWLKNDFVGAFESMLVGMPRRVVWAGDYADEEYTKTVRRKENKDELQRRKNLPENKFKKLKAEMITEELHVTLYDLCTDVNKLKPAGCTVKERYIVNHDTKEFIDKRKVPISDTYTDEKTGKKYEYRIHPLPLMTCEGNNRGDGDFHINPSAKQGNTALIGTWARNLISVEAKKPKGYKEVIFDLVEDR